MKLADYMHRHGLSPRELRNKLGVRSRSTVVRYITGERIPSPTMLNRIEELTGGAVTLWDFLDPKPAACRRVVIDRHGRPHEAYPWTSLEQRPAGKPARLGPPANESRERADPAAGPGPGRRPAPLGPFEQVDAWPSPPLRRALDVLGRRASVARRGGFLLDGRMVDSRRLVAAANRLLEEHELPPIPYPGVAPLDD